MIDVGIGGPGTKAAVWRRAWRDKIIPALVNFNPDCVFVSAGEDCFFEGSAIIKQVPSKIGTDFSGITFVRVTHPRY